MILRFNIFSFIISQKPQKINLRFLLFSVGNVHPKTVLKDTFLSESVLFAPQHIQYIIKSSACQHFVVFLYKVLCVAQKIIRNFKQIAYCKRGGFMIYYEWRKEGKVRWEDNRTTNDLPNLKRKKGKKEVRTNETLSTNRSEFSKGSTHQWQINFFQKEHPDNGKTTQAPEKMTQRVKWKTTAWGASQKHGGVTHNINEEMKRVKARSADPWSSQTSIDRQRRHLTAKPNVDPPLRICEIEMEVFVWEERSRQIRQGKRG